MALLLPSGAVPATQLPSGAREIRLIQQQSHLSAVCLELKAGVSHEVAGQEDMDTYLYVFSGEIKVSVSDGATTFAAGSFAAFPETTTITLAGLASESQVYLVTAKGASLAGVPKDSLVGDVAELPLVEVPEQLKTRTYLVGKESIPSERSHAMIVGYTGDTLTKSHHHPNAECVFFFLKGDALLLNEGKEEPVGPGDFAFFGANQSHGLRSANGEGLSFLEFHAPAEFVTVRE